MNKMLNPRKRKTGVGRMVGIIMITTMLGLGALSIHDEGAAARTGLLIPVSLGNTDFQMTEAARRDVAQALAAMTDDELILTYSRLHSAFRVYIGADDLSVARSLIDYAILAETELRSRGLSRPRNTSSAAEMMTTYNLVL